jgi:hypothetical protein
MANGLDSLTNSLTGGENKKAQEDLQAALNSIASVQTPSANQLQLSPLAQYQVTGELSPALMQAASAGPSAFNAENLSTVPMDAMQQALAKEKEIANAGGMTPQEQAAIAQAEESVNTNLAGQRGAIAQDFAGRGVPQSLIAAALENATAGQDSQAAYNAALTARANAANQGLTALSNEGSLAGQMFNEQAGQANTVAAAQNALNQFNAANTQAASAANQAATQQANTYNTTNAQTIADQNVTGEHQVQIQNQVEAPQEAAQLALQKAAAQAGVNENQAQQATGQGQQAAGLASGLLGAASNLGAAYLKSGGTPSTTPTQYTGPMSNNVPPPQNFQLYAEGGEIEPKPNVPAINFLDGGAVPGQARVAGDSTRNDTVPAKLSPGEFVVPRTAMARPDIRNFLSRNVPTPRPPAGAHPTDVASILKALSMLRAGQGA